MQLDNKLVHEFLLEQGITHLFHANTVGTACTFLTEGGLISRGGIENNGLFQTPQSSDNIDKKFDVWNDIFLDSIDLHGKFPRYNYYVPVVFKINVDILLLQELPAIYVTKDNPIRWKSHVDMEEYYFQNIDEFKDAYRIGAYKEMITLKDTLSTLYFGDYLEEIILDEPWVILTLSDTGEKIDLFKDARNTLDEYIKNSHYDYSKVKIKYRKKCPGVCYCSKNYLETSEQDLKRLFLIVDSSLANN